MHPCTSHQKDSDLRTKRHYKLYKMLAPYRGNKLLCAKKSSKLKQI